jgi:hypothetical protein
MDQVTPMSKGHLRFKRLWSLELKQSKADLNTIEKKAKKTQSLEDKKLPRKVSRSCTAIVRKTKLAEREKALNEAKGITI